MPRRTSVALLAAFCMSGGAFPVATAQDAINQGGQPRAVVPLPAHLRQPGFNPEPPRERPADVLGLDERVSIDFKGGTVAEYIQMVRNAAAPKAVNILVPTEVNDVPLPPIRLQSATLWTAWSALEPAIRAQPAGIDIAIAAMGERSGSSASSEAVQVLVDRSRRMGVTFPSDPVRNIEAVEVISIADLVEPRMGSGEPLMKVEDVLAAVEAAAMVADEAGTAKPTLKFHPSSGVLISRGGPGANALVNEVVSTIRKNAAVRAEQQDRAKLAKDAFEQRLRQAMAQFEEAGNTAETQKRRLDDAQKLAEAGSVSKSELEDMKASYAAALYNVDNARQQLGIVERTGVEGVMVEFATRSQNSDLSARVAQLEREVEALKTLISISTGRPVAPQPGRPGR